MMSSPIPVNPQGVHRTGSTPYVSSERMAWYSALKNSQILQFV